MAEYIEREKAIAICQSYYEHCLETHDYCGDSVAYDIRTNIQGLPTADVVPVVRCKDCKHGDFYCNSILCGNAHAPWYNDEFDALMELDDYCSYGERQGNK